MTTQKLKMGKIYILKKKIITAANTPFYISE